jgi:hypothetical protein
MAKVKRFNKGEEVELSGAEEEYQKNPQPAKEQVGRGFGADVTKPSADDAEFMASQVTSSGKSSPAVAKPKIVTKEELAKSGYDNLRDYLNAQKGLKPRGESASSKNPIDMEKGNSRGQKAPMATAVKITKGEGRKPYSPEPVGTSFPGSKFAKGGMARSSASKRADGCATKGFTKGRNL